MHRADILQIVRDHHAELQTHGVRSLALFGSVARDEAGLDSDVDLLVEFSQPVGLFECIRLQLRLEALLGCTVDLVTPDALRTSMRNHILAEAIHAA